MSRAEAARARWARIVDEQRASGMTVARFCEARGIAPSSFFPWKRRLAQGAQAGGVGSSTTAVFVGAKVPAASAPADAEGNRRGGVKKSIAVVESRWSRMNARQYAERWGVYGGAGARVLISRSPTC